MEMSISQVIAEITKSEGRTFLLMFVRSGDKKKGSIKTVVRGIYGAPARSGVEKVSGRNNALHKEKGTLPITDMETDEYLTPLTSHIIQFNQFKVKH